jgi:hypothetical protein
MLLATAATAQTDTGPTLDETLKWLDGKLRESFLLAEKNDEGKSILTSQTRSSQPLEQCVVKLNLLTEICVSGIDGCASTKESLTVPLGYLSLSDIKTTRYKSPDGYRQKAVSWWVSAATTKSATVIARTMTVTMPPNPPHDSTAFTSAFNLFFNDEELANRVKKALAHAAEVCGAKRDVF